VTAGFASCLGRTNCLVCREIWIFGTPRENTIQCSKNHFYWHISFLGEPGKRGGFGNRPFQKCSNSRLMGKVPKNLLPGRAETDSLVLRATIDTPNFRAQERPTANRERLIAEGILSTCQRATQAQRADLYACSYYKRWPKTRTGFGHPSGEWSEYFMLRSKGSVPILFGPEFAGCRLLDLLGMVGGWWVAWRAGSLELLAGSVAERLGACAA
jgi:hypothetical protein